MAHTYYPIHLYKNQRRIYLKNDTVAPSTKLPEATDPMDPESYSKYTLNEYSPDLMFTEMINFIDSNKDDPFFLYWATPIPHVALQAPPLWIDHYVKKFGDEKPYVGDNGYFPHRYPHAAYAAMISYLDDQVGKLIQHLKDINIYNNTLIIFSSDNGPTYNGGTDSPWFDSGGPFRSEQGFAKGSLFEGGIRVPMIAFWPGVIKPGSVSDHISAFWDVMPTLCEVAGIEIHDETDGISFLPELKGKKQMKHDYLYWEYPASGGQQAVISGNMKALRRNIQKGNTEFELFNLDEDPGEVVNVASKYPEVVKKVNEIVISEHQKSDNPLFQIKLLDSE